MTGRDGGAWGGLYVHVPFCSALCPYCDFAVTTGRRPERRAAFVAALLAEVGLHAGTPGEFDTVYFGGGTPSLLAPEELASVLAALAHALRLRPRTEVFLEANPEDVTSERVRAWRDLGVRFLSLGVQSLDDEALRFLGRRHRAAEARAAVRLARESGIPVVSFDVIYGLPGDRPERVRRDLEAAVGLAPQHLSCYQLTMPAGTLLGRRRERGEVAELPGERQAEVFALVHGLLADAGYEAYEVSNFAAAPRWRSRHNQKYWDHTPYLGFGPSAHSFGGNRRWWNERRLARWEERLRAGERPLAGGEELGPEELALEALLLGLRTRAGVDLARFRERFAIDLAARSAPLLAGLAGEGLIELAGSSLRPTSRGMAVADSLARAIARATLRGWSAPSPAVPP